MSSSGHDKAVKNIISQQLQLAALSLPKIGSASSQSWSEEELMRTQPSLLENSWRGMAL